MATFKLDTAPQRTPSQIVQEQKELAEKDYSSWVTERKRTREKHYTAFGGLLREDAKRYRRGSFLMVTVALLFLANRFVDFSQWYLFDWERMLYPIPLAMVGVTLLVAILDLMPYFRKNKMHFRRGYALFCRLLYWFSALLVVLSYAKGTLAQVIYAGFFVVMCVLLLWVNHLRRLYKKKSGQNYFLAFLRFVIIGCQCWAVFFPVYLAALVLELFQLIVG